MGQIYCIRNIINGKTYVGQTSFSFEHRYVKGRWWTTHNVMLKSDWKLYGERAFEVIILSDNIQEQDLNIQEAEWATRLDSYFPKGYNIQICGDRKILIDSRRRPVICSNGRVYESCSEAGRILNISPGHVSSCAKGVRRQTSGLTFSYDLSKVPVVQDKLNDNSVFPIICSNGNIYATIREACDDTGIQYDSSVSDVLAGRGKTAGGFAFEWYVGQEIPKTPVVKNIKQKVLRSDGVVFDSIRSVAKMAELQPFQLRKIIQSKECWRSFQYSILERKD